MSIWADHPGARYLADLRHPLIAREYDRRCRELGLHYGSGMNEQQRRDFDRAMLAKYGDRYPPPARTVWVLKSWEIIEQATANGIIKNG